MTRTSLVDIAMDEIHRLDDMERLRIRLQAQREATNALIAIVASLGGEVRIAPKFLQKYDYDTDYLETGIDPLTGETFYRTRPIRP